MAGRKGRSGGGNAKPTELKILQGTFRQERAPKHEAQVPAVSEAEAGAIPPPPFLTPEAAAEWTRLFPILVQAKLMTVADLTTFAMYCDAAGDWIRARKFLKRRRTTITTTNGNVIQHPAVGMLRVAREDARKLALEFGLSPSARSGIETGDGKLGQGGAPKTPPPRNRLGAAV